MVISLHPLGTLSFITNYMPATVLGTGYFKLTKPKKQIVVTLKHFAIFFLYETACCVLAIARIINKVYELGKNVH